MFSTEKHKDPLETPVPNICICVTYQIINLSGGQMHYSQQCHGAVKKHHPGMCKQAYRGQDTHSHYGVRCGRCRG